MLQQTLQPDLTLLPEPQTAASPFDDIATLHALYQPRLFRFLLLNTRDRDLALTLTQDAFLQVWRTRAQFRGDCSAYTWITRIALNLLRTHTRTESFRFWKRTAATAIDATELSSRLPANNRSAEDLLIARQSLAQVWQAVETLSPRQRTVFLLRFIEELELTDIATATNLPLPTVKSHLYRALDRIRAAHSQTRKARP
jgi:RNA polymerase sigma-70 factor, ECF subfamily